MRNTADLNLFALSFLKISFLMYFRRLKRYTEHNLDYSLVKSIKGGSWPSEMTKKKKTLTVLFFAQIFNRCFPIISYLELVSLFSRRKIGRMDPFRDLGNECKRCSLSYDIIIIHMHQSATAEIPTSIKYVNTVTKNLWFSCVTLNVMWATVRECCDIKWLTFPATALFSTVL